MHLHLVPAVAVGQPALLLPGLRGQGSLPDIGQVQHLVQVVQAGRGGVSALSAAPRRPPGVGGAHVARVQGVGRQLHLVAVTQLQVVGGAAAARAAEAVALAAEFCLVGRAGARVRLLLDLE